MVIVRLKSDPLKIVAFGGSKLGDLGVFDPDIYEELIVAEFPEGAAYTKLLTLLDQMDAVFRSFPPEIRAPFLVAKNVVRTELSNDNPDEEALHAFVSAVDTSGVPEAIRSQIDAAKQQILALLG